MIKVAAGTTLGLLFGAIVAAVVAPYAGMAGFSGRGSTIALGYACSVGVGATTGLVVGRRSGLRSTRASVMTGAMLALLATYVLRNVPLPWLNLVWLDGTAGPAGELPFIVLPGVGMLLGGIWGTAARSAVPVRRA
jgi:hypothetical protein